jgi:hypothetical protein
MRQQFSIDTFINTEHNEKLYPLVRNPGDDLKVIVTGFVVPVMRWNYPYPTIEDFTVIDRETHKDITYQLTSLQTELLEDEIIDSYYNK